MLRYAQDGDYTEIKKIYNNYYNDISYNDYYFNNLYNKEDVIVCNNEKEIMSIATRSKHIYMINNKPLKGSFIHGINTIKEYRNNGFNKRIINTIIDHAKHQELITFIKQDQYNINTKYGFEPIYNRVRYTINKHNNTMYDTSLCKTDNTSKELLNLYIEVMKRFNGYMIRDLKYYDNYLNIIKIKKGNIISIYQDNKIVGYMSLIKNGQEIIIEECLYLNSNALLSLISFAFKLGQTIQLNLTPYEKVDNLFEYTNKEIYSDTLMRINDIKLFNKLYQIEANNAKEAMKILNKPLFIRENM